MIPKFRAWYTPFKGEEFGQEMKYGQAGSLLTHAEMSPDLESMVRSMNRELYKFYKMKPYWGLEEVAEG